MELSELDKDIIERWFTIVLETVAGTLTIVGAVIGFVLNKE